jgi:TolB-like protein/Flp pilus assembly protein TadD
MLMRDGMPLAITPKAFDLLVVLVQNAGKLLDKDFLLQSIWPDTTVEENNLNQAITALRRVLGDAAGEPQSILTVAGKGYRFALATRRSAASPVAARVRIVVLPFENIGSDASLQYLADGFTEETISALGQVDPPHIAVVGRTTAMTYRHSTKTLAEIGRELQASYLVESSLRTENGRFRCTSKLIDAADELQVWSASFDSEPSSLLQFQRELATVIAEQIRLQLSPARLDLLTRRQTRSPEAYRLYLQGRHLWNQLTAPTTRKAIELFQQATAIDPTYALAWSGIADALSHSGIQADVPPMAIAARARDAAARALAAEPELAEVQVSVGSVRFWLDWDWKGAERAYRAAAALDPNYPMAHRMLAVVGFHCGREEEAAREIARARELDPLYGMHQALSSQVAFHARRYEEAVRFARQAIVIDPNFWIARLFLAQALVELGQMEEALESLAVAAQFGVVNSKVLALRGYILAKLGRAAEANEIVLTLNAIAAERFVPPGALAWVYLGLGQTGFALQALEDGLRIRDVHLAFLPVDPKWDVLRGNARFQRILAHCAFEREEEPELYRGLRAV